MHRGPECVSVGSVFCTGVRTRVWIPQQQIKSGIATCAPVASVLKDGLETAHWGLLAFCTAKTASSEVSEKPCLKRMRQRTIEDLILSSGLCGIGAHTHVCAYTPLYTQHMNAYCRIYSRFIKETAFYNDENFKPLKQMSCGGLSATNSSLVHPNHHFQKCQGCLEALRLPLVGIAVKHCASCSSCDFTKSLEQRD